MYTSRRLALAIVALLIAAALAPVISRSLAQGRLPAEPDMPMGWNFKNLSPEQQQRMLRFSTFVNKKVPEEYLTAENDVGYTTPLPREAPSISPNARSVMAIPGSAMASLLIR